MHRNIDSNRGNQCNATESAHWEIESDTEMLALEIEGRRIGHDYVDIGEEGRHAHRAAGR